MEYSNIYKQKYNIYIVYNLLIIETLANSLYNTLKPILKFKEITVHF